MSFATKRKDAEKIFFLICSLEAAHFRIENPAMGLNKSRFRKPASDTMYPKPGLS